MELTDKTAIVTGASRGIGKQIALELGRRGATVVVAARTVEPHRRLPGTIGETAAAIHALGGRAIAVQTDLTDMGSLERLVGQVIDRCGGVDVLVNNAADTSGASHPLPFAELPRKGWLREFDTNLHAPVFLIQLTVPSMTARGGGVIINLTSGAADLAPVNIQASSPGSPIGERSYAYAASKAALNRLGNAIASELRRSGVAIITIDPGFTRTELVELMEERAHLDITAAGATAVPAMAVVRVITSPDPMAYTGGVYRAVQLVGETSR